MTAYESFNEVMKEYPVDKRKIRAIYNRKIFNELERVISIKELCLELGISKNYYLNYLNGYSTLTILQMNKIIDFLCSAYSLGDTDFTFALIRENILYYWVLTKIYDY